MSERTEAACGLVLMLAVSSLVAAVLIAWADCGRACGAAGKTAQSTDKPMGAR